MSKLYLITFICGLLLVGADVSVADFSDDFEDGVIDTSLWLVGREKRGAYETDPPGIGNWQYPREEIIGADGYLSMRVWGPTSGYTYGAESWVRSVHNFNDGKDYVINFTWEAIVGEPTHYDYYYIQITDGYVPYYGSVHWPSTTRQNPEGTVNFLVDNDNGWSLTTGGISKTTWSMTITSDGIGKLYDGPNGRGSLIRQDSLDDSKPWYLRLMLIDATSAGFPGGDNRLNLYDFSAVSEPTDIEKFNLCSADLVCLYNFGAAIPWIGWAAEAAAIACDIKHIREIKEEGYEKIALAKEKLLAINFTLVLLDVVGDPVHDLILGGMSCIEAKIWEILKDCDDINWECIKQKWPELVDEFLIFPGPILAIIPRSPVDIKIYDSQGNVMELNAEGYTDNSLSSPGWIFKGPNNQELAIILEADDEYLSEVVGTEGGTYGLDIASVSGGEEITFEAIDIPTAPGEKHVYAVDWGALSAGGEGVILNIDKNGDGFFEQMAIADNELSYDEFALQTETVVDFDPDTLNLKSEGKFVTVYIELPEDFDASEIDLFSLELNELVPPLPKPIEIGDYDSNGTNDLMVKFDSQELMEVLETGEQIIDLTGRLWDGRPLAGFDIIRVIH